MESKVISGPYTGQQIIDAVKSVAGLESYRELETDQGFIVGKSSQVYFGNMVIVVDENMCLDPNNTYTHIVVKEHEWNAHTSTMMLSKSTIQKALDNFAESLTECLKQQSKVVNK